MRVFIFSGIPGSGKSTLIRELQRRNTLSRMVFSADDFFVDEDGEYQFDPSKLPDAHGWCLRMFAETVRRTFHERVTGMLGTITVDNTNTTVGEIAPYAALAQAYGHKVRIITVHPPDPQTAWARNQHGVPLDAVKAMAERIRLRSLPPWWDHVEIDNRDLGIKANIVQSFPR